MVMGRQDYQWKHEPCLYGWKKGASHGWYSDRKQTTVLEFDRPSRSEQHPTMKPIALFAYLIGNSTGPQGLILDSFLGSGTSLIAAEQLGRTCYGLELSPAYCDVIVARWETLTGKKAVLDGKTEA
jgi:site-specific DNA-methyltransferase (adenine-specific)